MFNQLKFNCTRGNLNCEASAYPGTSHYYVNLDDTIFSVGPNNMTSADYFPPNFGFREGQVQVNDLLYMRGGDGSAWAIVTAVSPSVMTSLYPNASAPISTTISTEASGIWAAPIPVTLELTRLDSMVYLTCTTSAQSAASIASEIEFTNGALNVSGFAPKYNNIVYAIIGSDNSVNQTVLLELTTAGDVNISTMTGNFTASGVGGFYRFFIAYEAA